MKDYPKDNQQRLALDDPNDKLLCQTERVRRFDTTKETLDKRVSKSEIQTREGSPLREAAFSRSESNTDRSESKVDQYGSKNLVSAARLLFPTRQKLYSVDVLGRRSEIETGHMSADAYQALREACQNPIRFDGPPQDYDLTAAQDTPMELPEGCKLGSETGLPLAEWWELPSVEATVEEIQAIIRRNLARAVREGKGAFSRELAASHVIAVSLVRIS